jgi:hypothetical protein
MKRKPTQPPRVRTNPSAASFANQPFLGASGFPEALFFCLPALRTGIPQERARPILLAAFYLPSYHWEGNASQGNTLSFFD